MEKTQFGDVFMYKYLHRTHELRLLRGEFINLKNVKLFGKDSISILSYIDLLRKTVYSCSECFLHSEINETATWLTPVPDKVEAFIRSFMILIMN